MMEEDMLPEDYGASTSTVTKVAPLNEVDIKKKENEEFKRHQEQIAHSR
jgi:hypothetical protein